MGMFDSGMSRLDYANLLSGLSGSANAAPNPMAQYKTVGYALDNPSSWGGNYQNAIDAAAKPISMVNGKVFYSTPASQIFSGNQRRESDLYTGWTNPEWFNQNTQAYTDPATGQSGFLIDPSLINDPNFALTKTGEYRDNSNKNGSLWTNLRDAGETAAVVAGNFFLPGSSLATSHLTSQGSQEQLNSGLGQIAQLASGVGGGLNGNLSNYGSLWDSAMGAGGATGGTGGAGGVVGSTTGYGADATMGLGDIGGLGATSGLGGGGGLGSLGSLGSAAGGSMTLSDIFGLAKNGVGIASGLNSLFGGGSSGGGGTAGGGSTPYQYIPTGQGGADTAWQNALQQLQNQASTTSSAINPIYLQSFLKQLGIDPSSLATSGTQAGQQYGQQAALNQAYSGVMGNQAGLDQQRQQAVWQAGADPNNAMYDRRRQQTIDTSRAADSSRGLAMSPYSSGNESTAVQNFNTDWDYNQLQRMLQANTGANATGQQMGADLTASSLFGGQVPGLTLQAGQAPIAGQTAAAQFPAQAATQYQGQLAGSNAQWQQLMNQVIPYLNFGSGAGANAYSQFAGQQANSQAQSAAGLEALMTGLGGLSNNANFGSALSSLFGGGSTGTGNQAYDPSMVADYASFGGW